jgi:hypothetical protein
LAAQVAQPGERIKELEEELRAQKKLKGKPKLKASQLNDIPAGQAMDKPVRLGKRSKKAGFRVDREEIIQPPVIPVGAKFNGYRTYDADCLTHLWKSLISGGGQWPKSPFS